MRRSRRYRLRQSAIHILVLFTVVQLGSVVYGLLSPDELPYTSFANVQTMLEAIPVVGIVALGVGVLMIAGEFDLSVGANYVFSNIIAADLATSGTNPFVAALIALLIGAGIGMVNGLITLRLKIPSFITTLGSAGVWAAGTLYVVGAGSVSFEASSSVFRSMTSGNIGVLSAEFLWFVVLGVALWALLQRHRIGNHIFAVGGNPQAAVANGIRLERVKLLAFVIAGFCAALAGMLAASRLTTINPDTGADLPLQAIAACVVGGVVLTGGRGTILGVMLGAALIYWIQDILLLAGAPGFYLSAFVGALIIAAAAMYQALRSRGA
jgi:ribose/xylose/arabinose/galactoside ABC-type transport system permease subunit